MSHVPTSCKELPAVGLKYMFGKDGKDLAPTPAPAASKIAQELSDGLSGLEPQFVFGSLKFNSLSLQPRLSSFCTPRSTDVAYPKISSAESLACVAVRFPVLLRPLLTKLKARAPKRKMASRIKMTAFPDRCRFMKLFFRCCFEEGSGRTGTGVLENFLGVFVQLGLLIRALGRWCG